MIAVYTWSPTTGLSPTSGSSVTATPTATTTYTITGTNGSCSLMRNVVVNVYQCCCSTNGADYTLGPIDSITDPSLPSGFAADLNTSNSGYDLLNTAGTQVVINGIFKIDYSDIRTLDMDNCKDLEFGPNAQIQVVQPSRLSLQGGDLKAAGCTNTMWAGIKTHGTPSEIDMEGGAKIEDAITALRLNSDVTIDISDATFNNNDTDMYITNYYATTTFYIAGCTFTTNNTGAYAGKLKLNPYSGDIAYAGIVLNSPLFRPTIGDNYSSQLVNQFSNKQFGILSMATDLLVYNNIFNNINPPPSSGIPIFYPYIYPPSGTAIFQSNIVYPVKFAYPLPLNSSDIVMVPQIFGTTIGGQNYAKNSFENCYQGVYTVGSNMRIYNNEFGDISPVTYGVQIFSSSVYNSYQTIGENYINSSNQGIRIFDNYNATYPLTVDSNTVNSAADAITISNHVGTVSTHLTSNSNIDLNKITMNEHIPSKPYHAIRMTYSTGTYIGANKIYNYSESDKQYKRGISLSMCSSNLIRCNYIYNMDYSMQFQGASTGLDIEGNSLTGYNYGWTLGERGIDYSSTINSQGSSNETTGNNFYGGSPISDLYTIHTDAGFIQYLVGSDPFPPSSSTATTGYTSIQIKLSGATLYYSCPGTPSECCYSTMVDVKEDSEIVTNSLSISSTDAPLTYFTLKKNIYENGIPGLYPLGLYTTLAETEALGLVSPSEDTLFTNFLDTMSSNNMSKFVQVDKLIDLMASSAISPDSLQTLIKAATTTDSLIDDVYIYESNLKSIDSIYLKTIAYGMYGIDSSQAVTLYGIATQCPYVGGEAVFEARAFLKLINDTTNYDDSALCVTYEMESDRQPYAVPMDTTYSFNLFPNPTNSTINLTYNLGKENNARLFVYDMLGKELLVVNIDNKNNFVSINVSNMSPGLYYARVSTNSKNLFGGKFSVIR